MGGRGGRGPSHLVLKIERYSSLSRGTPKGPVNGWNSYIAARKRSRLGGKKKTGRSLRPKPEGPRHCRRSYRREVCRHLPREREKEGEGPDNALEKTDIFDHDRSRSQKEEEKEISVPMGIGIWSMSKRLRRKGKRKDTSTLSRPHGVCKASGAISFS